MIYLFVFILLTFFYFALGLLKLRSVFFARMDLFIVLPKLKSMSFYLSLAFILFFPFHAYSEMDPVALELIQEMENNILLSTLKIFKTNYRSYDFDQMPDLFSQDLKDSIEVFASSHCDSPIIEALGASTRKEKIALKIQMLIVEELSVKHNMTLFGSNFVLGLDQWKALFTCEDDMKKFVHFSSFFGIDYMLETFEFNAKELCLFPEIEHDKIGAHFGPSVKHLPALESLVKHLPDNLKMCAKVYISELTSVSENFQKGHKFYCGTSDEQTETNRLYHRYNDFSHRERSYFYRNAKESLPLYSRNPPLVISKALRDDKFPFFHHVFRNKTLAEEHYEGFSQVADPQLPATSNTDWTKVFSSGPL